METHILSDARIQALLTSLLEMAALGERAKPVPLSDRHDEVDAIAYAFNVLLGELRFASLSKQRVESILNAIHDPVLVIERTGTIRIANQAAQEWAGQANASIFDRPFLDLIEPDEHTGQLIATWQDGVRTANLPIRVRSGEGQFIPFTINAAPLVEDEGAPDAIVLVAHDLRESMRLAEAAASARDEALRSNALRAAKNEAERANAAKSAFLRNVSHELRTPLTVLLASTQILTRADLSPDMRQETTDRISRAGDVLLGLIDNVLDISKIEAGRIDYLHVPFRLNELLQDVSTSFGAQADAKGLRLEVLFAPEASLLLESDPRRIRQILFNLVGNAIKYTQQGLVRVESKLQGTNSSARLFFSVHDTGAGIRQEEQEKLFQVFGRASDTSTTQGTGLGLYLSRKLAVGLGGALELAATEAGGGSRFELYVPVKVIAGKVDAKEPGPSLINSLQGIRILVADDNLDIRGVVRALLEIEGARVTEAFDGEDAVQKALGATYDVVLMDVRMPNKTGLEAVRELRAGGYPGAILALTADAVRELREECLAAGYDDYVAKPIEFDLLVAKLRDYSFR